MKNMADMAKFKKEAAKKTDAPAKTSSTPESNKD